ncbi:MAG: MBOAT family protein [Pseudomonadota bacterium]|nr:MBOAT family protein [Pseudomonadota bacterium]
MLFSSMTFIFLFLPSLCVLYFSISKIFPKTKYKDYLLLLASIFFYAWGEPRYVIIMLTTIAINYFGALCLDKFSEHKKSVLMLIILIDLSFLIYFKYFNFIVDNLNTLFTADFNMIRVVMPIGISFYTFQSMSYLIDVYRGTVKVQKNIIKLALYICLFPQLIAGPIVQYADIAAQIDKRTENFDKIVYGVKRFIVGLAKKVLLANTLGGVADKIFDVPVNSFPPAIAWIGGISYTLQLFYDFSGYSDMAIGLGSIFGFKFLENFNYPYISKSITEFWRRWHISLSAWFKNYLYIPLGGNREGAVHTYINLFIVFLATGIWHGSGWNFIIWGLWHGLFVILEKLTGWYKIEQKKMVPLQHLTTLFVVIIGWVMFRSENLTYGLNYIKNMFGLLKNINSLYGLDYYGNSVEMMAFIVGILCSMPIFKNCVYPPKNKFVHIGLNLWIMILFLSSVMSLMASTYNPFIYFRF